MSAAARTSRREEPTRAPAYRKHAGHAAHFLRRLDRVDPRQAELALALYNDPALVRATLARASLPEGVERVAISLNDANEGPFLVVTREGRFVTCLGAGMRVRQPVITRVQLDAAAREVERMRQLIAQAEHANANRGRVRAMITRLLQGGEHVTREQMEEVLRWEPLLGNIFLSTLGQCSAVLLMMAPRVRNILRPRARHEELLFEYHRALYALGHFYVLAGASEVSRSWLDDALSEGPLPMTLSGLASPHDVAYVSARAMWATARWPALMSSQKEMLRNAEHPIDLSDGYFGVTAIGLGKRALRAEAQRAVASERTPPPHLAELAAIHRSHLSMAFTHHELISEWGMTRGRMALRERVPGLRMQDISDADARAQLASAPGHAVRTPDDIAASSIAVPCIVRAAPQDLYLPAATIEATRTPWTMQKTIDLVAGQRHAYGVQRPVRVVRTAGPNDRCPCGSERKRKRCCPRAGRERVMSHQRQRVHSEDAMDPSGHA